MTTKNKSIVALVCGILGIVGGWFPIVCYFTTVLAIVGIVFGAMALKDKPEGSDKGMAVAGLVCGIVGAVFGLIGIICAVCACMFAGAVTQAVTSAGGELESAFNDALNEIANSMNMFIA